MILEFILCFLHNILSLLIWLCFSCFIDFEIARQIDILEAGGEVVNETRAFNFDTGYSFANFLYTISVYFCTCLVWHSVVMAISRFS